MYFRYYVRNLPQKDWIKINANNLKPKRFKAQKKEAEKQAQLYETLRSRDIHPTRYADETCLRQLGLYHSVNHMLNLLDLNYFLSKKDPVYVQLTL
jgi:hypothetical protein